MLDNLLERAVAALESIADSLEVIAGGDVAVTGAASSVAVDETPVTVAQAKEKKPRGTSRKKAESEPAPTAAASLTETPIDARVPTMQSVAATAATCTLDQANNALIAAVNERGVPASAIMDVLREYAPEANLRYIDAKHYSEIITRVSAL